MRRQNALYDPEKTFRFLVCVAALYHRSCSADVMAPAPPDRQRSAMPSPAPGTLNRDGWLPARSSNTTHIHATSEKITGRQ